MLNVFRGVLVDTVGSSERVPWVLQSLQQTQKCSHGVMEWVVVVFFFLILTIISNC